MHCHRQNLWGRTVRISLIVANAIDRTKYQSFGKVTLSFSDILHCGMPPRGAPGEMFACCRMAYQVHCVETVLAYISSVLQAVERTMQNASFGNKCSTFVLCHIMSNVLVKNEHFVNQLFAKGNWRATISLNLSRYLE